MLGVGRQGDETVQAQIDYDVAAADGGGGKGFRKALRLNGIVRSSHDFVGHLNVVFFEADDLEIVLGSPSTRRLSTSTAHRRGPSLRWSTLFFRCHLTNMPASLYRRHPRTRVRPSHDRAIRPVGGLI